jgi:hypothetical protein
MTDHSVKHSTFTLERTYAASPGAVFAAWSDRDFLDDQEQPEWREQGTGDWLDALGREVAQR